MSTKTLAFLTWLFPQAIAHARMEAHGEGWHLGHSAGWEQGLSEGVRQVPHHHRQMLVNLDAANVERARLTREIEGLKALLAKLGWPEKKPTTFRELTKAGA